MNLVDELLKADVKKAAELATGEFKSKRNSVWKTDADLCRRL